MTAITRGEDRRGNIDTSRISSEYNSTREIRVKSVTSNGYIKLF